MKSRKPPKPASGKYQRRLNHDRQVQRWIQRLTGDIEARPADLTEDQLAFVYAEVLRRRGDLAPTAFEKAMVETTPKVAAPDFTDPVEDLGLIFALPEMESFWRRWTGYSNGKRRPPWAGAKAIAAYLSMTGKTNYLDDAHQDVTASDDLLQLFAEIDRRSHLPGTPGTPFMVAPYSSTARHMPRIAQSCWRLAMETNVAIVKELARLRPDVGFGKRLMIDGTPIPAWVPQRGSRGNPEVEQLLRKKAPHAGFRVYSHNGNKGKQNLKPGDQVTVGAGVTKAWRGYYLVTIADQASGLPLVWMVIDAATDEAATLIPLLSDLYKLWPDIPAELIVGDSAWDEDRWCRLCEVEYGLAPVFRLHPSARKKSGSYLEPGLSRDGSVRGITGEGHLICAVHGERLEYDTCDRPNRNGLYPGQPADEGKFRLRGLCRHSSPGHPACGRVVSGCRPTGVPSPASPPRQRQTRRSTRCGRPSLARLCGIEGLWNRVKSTGLGAAGANRPRVEAKETVEMFVSLNLLSMSALMLVDQRQQLALPLYQVPAATQPSGATGPAPSTTAQTGASNQVAANAARVSPAGRAPPHHPPRRSDRPRPPRPPRRHQPREEQPVNTPYLTGGRP